MASSISTAAPSLPLDIWLLVFEHVDDINHLWSTCRSVSRFWRARVDSFFRYSVLRNTFVDLHYSDIHTCRGPLNSYIHIPMVFDRMSDNGTLAVFKQRVYKHNDGCLQNGSVRGWVPFVERYRKETRQPALKILHKRKASSEPPLWEQLHTHWNTTLNDAMKGRYLGNLGNMTSIGRGDRPPFYLKIFDDVNDTDLVDLVVECANNEILFNWRETYNLFFREKNFVARTQNRPGNKRLYDADLVAVSWRFDFSHDSENHNLRARRKRLMTWTAQNKHRMSSQMRLKTERRVDAEKVRMQRFLNHDNLALVAEDDHHATDEIVPEQLARDYPALLFWPRTDNDGFYTTGKRPLNRINCCTLL